MFSAALCQNEQSALAYQQEIEQPFYNRLKLVMISCNKASHIKPCAKINCHLSLPFERYIIPFYPDYPVFVFKFLVLFICKYPKKDL